MCRLQQHGEEFGDLPFAASRKQPHQPILPQRPRSLPAMPRHQRMPREFRVQSESLIEFLFEGKDAQHEIQPFGHLGNPPAMPCPHLRTDVINDFTAKSPRPQGLGETQVEARVVDQHHGVGLGTLDARQRRRHLPAEPVVFPQHFHHAHHPCLLHPILHAIPGDALHLRPPQPLEFPRWRFVPQRFHEPGSMPVPAAFSHHYEYPGHRPATSATISRWRNQGISEA